MQEMIKKIVVKSSSYYNDRIYVDKAYISTDKDNESFSYVGFRICKKY